MLLLQSGYPAEERAHLRRCLKPHTATDEPLERNGQQVQRNEP